MRLAHSLATVAAVSPDPFEDLRRNIDPEWVVQALEATGTATVRSRRLPAEQVVWLVIGMALFRNRSIHDVVSKLDLALPSISPTVAPSSVAQARARLGPDPMEWLFAICAEHWAHASARSHPWRGLALYGVDGTTLRVPDSTDNAGYFGYSHSARGESAYPMVRGVGLMALRSHLLTAVTFGPYATGEISYATNLWSSLLRDSLTIVSPVGRARRNRWPDRSCCGREPSGVGPSRRSRAGRRRTAGSTSPSTPATAAISGLAARRRLVQELAQALRFFAGQLVCVVEQAQEHRPQGREICGGHEVGAPTVEQIGYDRGRCRTQWRVPCQPLVQEPGQRR